jgi:hypothetical protein
MALCRMDFRRSLSGSGESHARRGRDLEQHFMRCVAAGDKRISPQRTHFRFQANTHKKELISGGDNVRIGRYAEMSHWLCGKYGGLPSH